MEYDLFNSDLDQFHIFVIVRHQLKCDQFKLKSDIGQKSENQREKNKNKKKTYVSKKYLLSCINCKD